MQGRIAVIGANGYLGRALVPLLRAEGRSVTSIGRHLPASHPPGTTFHLCDARDADVLGRAIRDCSVVVQAMRGTPGAMAAAARALAACRTAGWHGRVILISSLAVYGQRSGVLDEAVEPAPAHAYGRAKRVAETLTADGDTVLRPGCVYGPASPLWVDGLARLVLEGRLGPLGAAGEGACPLLHVQDLARCIRAAIEAGPAAAGVFNLPGETGLSWNRYFTLLAEGVDRPPSVLPLARRALETLRAPLSRGLAAAGIGDGAAVTPSLWRLFRSRAVYATARTPLLPAAQHVPLAAGLPPALQDFWRRHGPTPQLSASWARAA